MGNPHYNTWGGKNNSWGNRNRKGKSSGSSGNSGGGGGFNTFGKVFIGGCVLLALSQTGLGPIIETADNIKDAFDIGSKVRNNKSSSSSKSNSKSSSKSNKSAKHSKSSKYDTKIGASDVKDILEHISDVMTDLESEGIDTSDTGVVTVDYSAFDSDADYIVAIKNRLPDLDKTTTFIATSKKMSYNKMEDEYERLVEVINNNLSAPNGIFTGVRIKGILGVPDNDKLTITVTYYVN